MTTEEKDYFLDDQHCIERLFEEWKKYGLLIIAFDFDNTIFDYYKKGYKYRNVINLLDECYNLGFHLTLFTSCNEDRMPEIRKYLSDNNIPYDSINETPDFIPFRGRKVYYNLLLDDRAGLSSAYHQLKEVIQLIRIHKHNESTALKQDIDF